MVFGWRFKRQYAVSVVMLCELEAVVSPPKLRYVGDIGSEVLSKKSCQVDALHFLSAALVLRIVHAYSVNLKTVLLWILSSIKCGTSQD